MTRTLDFLGAATPVACVVLPVLWIMWGGR